MYVCTFSWLVHYIPLCIISAKLEECLNKASHCDPFRKEARNVTCHKSWKEKHESKYSVKESRIMKLDR